MEKVTQTTLDVNRPPIGPGDGGWVGAVERVQAFLDPGWLAWRGVGRALSKELVDRLGCCVSALPVSTPLQWEKNSFRVSVGRGRGHSSFRRSSRGGDVAAVQAKGED